MEEGVNIYFIIGCIIGSFLNVIIYRLPKNIQFIKGRSYCPHCHHDLYPLDLIPILSYISLKGRCRYCHQKISIQYPIIELITGLLAQFLCPNYFLLIVSCIFICISIIDYQYMIIPDLLQILLLLTFVYFKRFDIQYIGLCVPFIMIIINLFHESFGGGDIKLSIILGLYLGYCYFYAVLIANIIACLSLIPKFLNKSISIKDHIPYGPYLCIGTFIILLLEYKW